MHTQSEITRAPQLGHYEIDASRSTVIFRTRHMFGLGSAGVMATPELAGRYLDLTVEVRCARR